MADINNRTEYDHEGYTPGNSGLLKTITHVSTIREQRGFRHVQRLWGLICEVFFPVAGEYDPYTREGSNYNREDNKYRYKNEPDISEANLVLSNLMDLTRMDSATRMDNLNMQGEIFAFTNLVKYNEKLKSPVCQIPVNSKLKVKYNNKDYVYFVWQITSLSSPHMAEEQKADEKAIFRLELKSHN